MKSLNKFAAFSVLSTIFLPNNSSAYTTYEALEVHKHFIAFTNARMSEFSDMTYSEVQNNYYYNNISKTLTNTAFRANNDHSVWLKSKHTNTKKINYHGTGAILGYNMQFNDSFSIALSGAFDRGKVKVADYNDVKPEFMFGMATGRYNFDLPYFVDISYAYGKIKTKKTDIKLGSNRIHNLGTKLGYTIPLMNDLYFVPSIGVNQLFYGTKFSRDFRASNSRATYGNAEFRIENIIDYNQFVLVPYFNISYNHKIVNSSNKVTHIASKDVASDKKMPEKYRTAIALGMNSKFNDAMQFGLGYQYNKGSVSHGHSVNLGAKITF